MPRARTARFAMSSPESTRRRCRVVSFKQPTLTELAHDYLWRVHAMCPARGELGIFNRSHYEDLVTVRVRGLVPEHVWKRRPKQVREFERTLSEEGTAIVKVFLHVSADAQRERLEERLAEPREGLEVQPRGSRRPRPAKRLPRGVRGGHLRDVDRLGAVARRSGRPQLDSQPRGRGAARAHAARARPAAAAGRPGARGAAASCDASSLTYRERPADGEAEGLLVLHHGRGSDEHDLLSLGDVLDPQRRLHVVTPRAPLTLPGWPGHHWYVVPRVGYPDPDTFHAAYRRLAEFHDELWAADGDPARPDGARRLLDGLGDELLARPRPRPPGAGGHPRVLGLRARRRRLGAGPRRPPGPPGLHRARPQRPDHGRRASPAPRASCSRPAASTSRTTSPTSAHQIDPAHLPGRDRLARRSAPLDRSGVDRPPLYLGRSPTACTADA